MPTKLQFLQALASGDAALLVSDDVEQIVAQDPEIHTAVRRAAEQVVSFRASFRDVIARTVQLGVPCDVWTAARAGLVDHVNALLSARPHLLNATDPLGRTPLQRAALVYGISRECEEVADVLIRRGATIDIWTAATFCLPDIVEREIERDNEAATLRCQGSNTLNWAVRPRRNYEAAPCVCQRLLIGKANVHDRDQDEFGMTPLHHAAEWGAPICRPLIDQLLAAGADINGVDDRNWTPLDYARDRKRNSTVDHLVALGARSGTTQ